MQFTVDYGKCLKSGPTMDLNNLSFQKLAFDSHLPAYINAGFWDWIFLDETHIATPDVKDLTNLGIAQAKTI